MESIGYFLRYLNPKKHSTFVYLSEPPALTNISWNAAGLQHYKTFIPDNKQFALRAEIRRDVVDNNKLNERIELIRTIPGIKDSVTVFSARASKSPDELNPTYSVAIAATIDITKELSTFVFYPGRSRYDERTPEIKSDNIYAHLPISDYLPLGIAILTAHGIPDTGTLPDRIHTKSTIDFFLGQMALENYGTQILLPSN